MWSCDEVEVLARLQREEVARQVAAVRRAQLAEGAAGRGRWRRPLAAALRALAARLAPLPVEPAAVEPSVS